jgi:3-hydroxyacyl-[acyl-carrier-protein] dehydratase
MKLINSFFEINSFNELETGFSYTISFNPEHLIYKAHFPERPITPGVCILQVASELLEQKMNRPLFLSLASNVKYLAVLSPNDDISVSYDFSKMTVDEKECKVHVTVKNNHCIFAKLSLTFVYEPI